MAYFRITLKNTTKKELGCLLLNARKNGDLAAVKRILAIFAIVQDFTYDVTSQILQVSEESIRLWIKEFLLKGPEGLIKKGSPGRPAKLTKTQRKELKRLIIEGPVAAGFPGACWRSPMIQALIFDRFEVLYSVYYIAQLLKNMNFSYQKAKFVSDDKDPEKRKEWLEKTWPEIVKLAAEKNSYILFGDEASFPQWGSLTYTWSLRGKQPVVPTSGVRKGYKVMGLIEYRTGRFFHKCHEKRLNSEVYQEFLKEIMGKTRRHIILIQDGARYHTSAAMREFFEMHSNRITVYQLPAYSPDYNPIEKVWKKIKGREIHLHYFPTFESLKARVNEALLHFEDLKEEIIAVFGFYDRLEIQAA